MMVVLATVFAALAVFLLIRCLAYKVSAMAILHYYLEKGNAPPSAEEMKALTKEAARHLFD